MKERTEEVKEQIERVEGLSDLSMMETLMVGRKIRWLEN